MNGLPWEEEEPLGSKRRDPETYYIVPKKHAEAFLKLCEMACNDLQYSESGFGVYTLALKIWHSIFEKGGEGK